MFKSLEIENEEVQDIPRLNDLGSDTKNMPEHQLIAEILSRALVDYIELKLDEKKRKMNRAAWYEVREWIHSNQQSPFSFLWIVDNLFADAENMAIFIRQRVEMIEADEEMLSVHADKKLSYLFRRKPRLRKKDVGK